MSLIVIPNVSEGRSSDVVTGLVTAVSTAGARVLDVHSDAVHNRSVITGASDIDSEIDAMVALAAACTQVIDLTRHEGTHPRVGALDVCPFVPHGRGTIGEAVAAARECGGRIASELHLPVFLYGRAAEGRAIELADIRRAAGSDRLRPDRGPTTIDPQRGAVCVGARDVLIAFNVWIAADIRLARSVAAAVREANGGPTGLRALGLPVDQTTSQVSMNITQPELAGIDEVFATVAQHVRSREGEVVGTEIVGLVPDRFMPDPHAEAARLLISPGRSLESALKS